MKAVVVKQKAVRGFLPITYAVFSGEYLIQAFTSRQAAEACAERWNKANGF